MTGDPEVQCQFFSLCSGTNEDRMKLVEDSNNCEAIRRHWYLLVIITVVISIFPVFRLIKYLIKHKR